MRQWSKRREQIAEATDPCSGASLREAIRTPSLIVAPHKRRHGTATVDIPGKRRLASAGAGNGVG
jgi:hypothetical protein